MAAELAIKITADGKAVVTAAQDARQALAGIDAQAGKTAVSLQGTAQASAGLDAAMKKLNGSAQGSGLPAYAAELAGVKSQLSACMAQIDGLKTHVDSLNARLAQKVPVLPGAAQELDKVGISAKQTAAALRGVPAQFTDIAVSLQGGQAPLTVFLQQGGQLKDMFGGAGAAARALGGYVLGLINPFTVAAAAAGGLGYAMYAGAEQQRAFRGALILSGNAAGATASQIEAAYARVSKATGQNGDSEAAIIGLVKGRQVAVEQLEATAAAVVRFSRAAGVEAKTLVEDFNAIGKDPVKAVLALQEKYGVLTAATYQQAAALTEQGKKQEAVTLVMTEAGKAMDEIGKKAKENKGSIEAFWDILKSGAGGLWQGTMDLGKDATPEQELSKQKALLQGLSDRVPSASRWQLPGISAAADAAHTEILRLETLIGAQKALAKAQGEAAEVNERATAGIAKINAGYESHLNKTQQLTKALQDLKIARDDAIRGPGVDVGEINRKYASEVENLKRQLAPSFDMASLMHSLYIQESGNRQLNDDGTVKRNVSSGATGIAQIVPKYGPDYARMAGVDWSKELLETSADYGKKLAEAGIKTYLKMFDNDLEKALSAYNAGPGTVKKAIAKAGPDGDWRTAMRDPGIQSEANYQQTKTYREKILGRLPKDSAGDYGSALGAAPESAFDKQLVETRKMLAAATAEADAAQRGLTKSQAEFEKVQASPAWAAYNAGQKSSIELMYEQADVQERIKKSAEDGIKIKGKADAIEAMNAAYGQSQIEVEKWTANQLGANAAVAEAIGLAPALVAQLKATAEQQRRVVDGMQEAENKKFGERSDELLRAASEQVKLYEDEAKLSGLTALERAKIVAQRQVELKYAKEIADVNKSGLSDDQKQAQILKLSEARQIESSNAVNKVVQDDWAKTSEQINQSLTDALMRGFESGKGFGQNLRDTLVNMFKTMVLRPTIEAVLSPVSGAINGVVNGVVGGGSGGMLGIASGASSLYSNGAALGGLFASNAAYGAAIGTTSIGAGSQAAMLASQTGVFGAQGVLMTSQAGAVAGGAGSGVMGALGAIGPAGWAALAALAVVAVVASQKGDSRFGSQASYTPKDGAKSYGGPNGAADDFGGVSAANKASAMSIDMLLKKVGSLDTLARFGSGFESSEKGKGFSYAGGTLSNGKAFGQGNDGMGYMNNRGSMNAEEAQASYIKELKQATLQALQSATDIPKSISEKLAGVNIDSLSDAALTELSTTIDRIIGEVDTFKISMESLPFSNLKDLSFEAAAGLIAASGGFETLSANLATYYENFYSAEERRVQTVKNITAALNAAGGDVTAEQVANASRAQFRAYAEGVDTTTAAGQKLYAALLGVSGAFAVITDAAVDTSAALLSGVSTARQALDKALADQNNVLTTSYRSQSSELQSTITKFRGFADQLKKFRDGLLLGGMSPLTPEQRYAEAQRQFESAKSGGDAGELQTASSALLEASKVYNASNATYISDFSKVQEALSAAAINASATADVAQLQLSAVQSQLSVLERVNSSVLSVADAMAGLTAAVIAAVSGGANPGLANIARITGGAVDREVGNAYMSSGGAGAVRGTKGWQVFTPGGDSFSQDYAKQFVKDQLAANNPREIYDAAKRSGLSLRALDDLINWAPGTAEQWAIENGLPTFANGGNHAGGWAMVGERGPELAYMPPARIYNAGDTSRMTDGRGNAELVAEIRALREEVKQLRTEQNQQTGALIQSNYDASAQNADAITTRQSKQGWSKKEPELA